MVPTDDELARQFQAAVRHIHRVRWVAVGALGAIIALAVAVGAVMLIRDQSQLRASCAFYRDIGTLSVAPQPPAKKPGEVGVALVVHAREAYTGQGCGDLPPTTPVLRRWAVYYRLPAR